MDSNGGCICPIGYIISSNLSEGNCIPCQVNSYSNHINSLQCDLCQAGEISLVGASTCTKCLNGQFRTLDQTECASCSIGWYALDATDPWSCILCDQNCINGEYSIACPSNEGDSNLVKCMACDYLPGNASWSLGCNYNCHNGFYHTLDKKCDPCTTGPCEPGKIRSMCTIDKDSTCDTDCTNSTKPLYYSTWKIGCEWGCIPGYCVALRDYLMFQVWECVRCW